MTTWPHGTMYLTVRQDRPRGVVPVKVTKKPPTEVPTGCVVVKLHVTVPPIAFAPLESDPVTVHPHAVTTRADVTADSR